MTELEKARILINEADEKIADGFEKRFEAVTRIGAYKREKGLPVYDPVREAEVIKRNAARISDPVMRPYYVRLLQYMMDLAKEYQEELNTNGGTESEDEKR